MQIISIKVVQDIRCKRAKKMGTSIGPGHGNSSTFCSLPPVISNSADRKTSSKNNSDM